MRFSIPLEVSRILSRAHLPDEPGNIRGVHHGVSEKYLDRYLAEFSYRFNRRYWDSQIFNRTVIACVSTSTVTFAELRAWSNPEILCPFNPKSSRTIRVNSCLCPTGHILGIPMVEPQSRPDQTQGYRLIADPAFPPAVSFRPAHARGD